MAKQEDCRYYFLLNEAADVDQMCRSIMGFSKKTGGHTFYWNSQHSVQPDGKVWLTVVAGESIGGDGFWTICKQCGKEWTFMLSLNGKVYCVKHFFTNINYFLSAHGFPHRAVNLMTKETTEVEEGQQQTKKKPETPENDEEEMKHDKMIACEPKEKAEQQQQTNKNQQPPRRDYLLNFQPDVQHMLSTIASYINSSTGTGPSFFWYAQLVMNTSGKLWMHVMAGDSKASGATCQKCDKQCSYLLTLDGSGCYCFKHYLNELIKVLDFYRIDHPDIEYNAKEDLSSQGATKDQEDLQVNVMAKEEEQQVKQAEIKQQPSSEPQQQPQVSIILQQLLSQAQQLYQHPILSKSQVHEFEHVLDLIKLAQGEFGRNYIILDDLSPQVAFWLEQAKFVITTPAYYNPQAHCESILWSRAKAKIADLNSKVMVCWSFPDNTK